MKHPGTRRILAHSRTQSTWALRHLVILALEALCLADSLLRDLSKVFDRIKHDLLVAKLAEYGLDYHSLSSILSYLPERKQRVKTHNFYSPSVI